MLSSTFRRWLRYPIQTVPGDRLESLRVKTGGTRRAVGFRPHLEILEDRTVLSPPGTLDPSFGTQGIVTTDFAFGFDQASAVAIQPADSKIVVVGSSGADFALARYNTDGSLDTTFNATGTTPGEVTTAFPLAKATANVVALQPDGKIVVAGFTLTGVLTHFALARYNSDGSLDTTFNAAGIIPGEVTTDFGTGGSRANAVAVQADGKIVAAGFANVPVVGNEFALARYNTDGSLDTTFKNATSTIPGEVTTLIGADGDSANMIAIQTDGKIVAAGTARLSGTNFAFALARYNADGSLDGGFSGGIITTDFAPGRDQANAVVLQPDGKIVAAGFTPGAVPGSDDFALARYNVGVAGQPDGSLDTTFNATGKTPGEVTTDFASGSDQANGVALQADGKIVAVGSTIPFGTTSDEFALAQYNTDGTLDSNFGTNGEVTTVIGTGGDDEAFGVAIEPPPPGSTQSRIVVAGFTLDVLSLNDYEFAVTQYFGDTVAAPTISSLSPASVSEGSADFTLAVNGTNFISTSTVQGNGTPLTTTFVSSTQLQATVAAANVADEGTLNVTVVNPAPGGGTSNAQSLMATVVAPTASVSGPASGIVGQPLTFSLNASSPSADDSMHGFAYTIVWGDGTLTTLPALPNNGTGETATHTYSAIGPYTVQVTATDDSGTASAPSTQSLSIFYKFIGFFQPVSLGLPFEVGRTIPLKFQLTDFSGNPITTLSPVMILSELAVDANGNRLPDADAVPLTPAGDTHLRFDDDHYMFNWKTDGLNAGFYKVLLTLNTGIPVTATPTTPTVLLVTSAADLAQLAGGTGSSTTTAGALLAGDLEVYVNDPNGLFSADALARIQDAINAADAAVEPFGVAVTETTDSTAANVVVDTGSASALGGYSDGVLGCYTSAGEITLIQGWNWYAGADGSAIGANQYDFQTTVTHELGHALGLGESSDPTSVMSGTLATGTVIRTLTKADLNIAATETGASAQSAATPASALLLPSRAFADAAPLPVVVSTVVSLPTAGTVPPIGIPGTPDSAPSIRLESGGGDNAAEPGDQAELVPLPPAANPGAPLPAPPLRPAEAGPGDAPVDLAWWRATCTACFADDSARNAPDGHRSSDLPPASVPGAAVADASPAVDPAAAAAAFAVVLGGYWRSPAEFVDRGKKELQGS